MNKRIVKNCLAFLLLFAVLQLSAQPIGPVIADDEGGGGNGDDCKFYLDVKVKLANLDQFLPAPDPGRILRAA